MSSRCARYGGLARPAEFLVACCGLPALAWGVENLLLRSFVRQRTGIVLSGPHMDGMPVSTYQEWQAGPHWAFEEGLFLTGVLAAVAFLLGRRRLPGWLLTALLLSAWLGFAVAGPVLLRRGVGFLILRVIGSAVGKLAGSLIAIVDWYIPTFLLYAVPALVALRDVRRTGDSPPVLVGLDRTGSRGPPVPGLGDRLPRPTLFRHPGWKRVLDQGNTSP